jgi:transposase
MRGWKATQGWIIHLIALEMLDDAKHSIRPVEPMYDHILAGMDTLFIEIYAEESRPSGPLERLLMRWTLMTLSSPRSCRHFAEQLRYSMLFKWLLDTDPDEVVSTRAPFPKTLSGLKTSPQRALFLLSWLP